MTEDLPAPTGELVFYQTEDGRTRIECRFENETIWLSQALIAELFQKDVRTISEHLTSIFAEGELDAAATIRKFRIVRREGRRQVTRHIEHYNLASRRKRGGGQAELAEAVPSRISDLQAEKQPVPVSCSWGSL